MDEQNQEKKYPSPIYGIFLIHLLTVFFLFLIAFNEHFQFLSFFNRIIMSLNYSDINNCTLFLLNNQNFNIYIYLIIISIIIGFKILDRIPFLQKYYSNPLPFANHSLKVSIGMFIFLLGLQWIGHFKYFSQAFDSLAGKVIEEKYSQTYRELYDFSVFCHRHLPGKHLGLFVTDMDIEHSEVAFYKQIVLGYFLYPITIKPIPGQDSYQHDNPAIPDALIIFAKSNPTKAIPKDFEYLASFDQHSLIGIRKRTKLK